MKKAEFQLIAILAVLMLWAVPAMACVPPGCIEGVYGDEANLTGTLSMVNGGLKDIKNNDYTPAGAAVSWYIEDLGDVWSYTYTFTRFENSISHITIDVTDTFARPGSGVVINDEVYLNGDTNNPITPEFGSNLEIEGAFKVEPLGENEGELTLAFLSLNSPVWGNIYIKDGTHYDAVNTGYITNDPLLRECYIARPDSRPVVPEPASLLLMGSGVLAAFIRKRTLG